MLLQLSSCTYVYNYFSENARIKFIPIDADVSGVVMEPTPNLICYGLVDWLIRYPMTAVVTVVFTSCPTRGGQQRNQFRCDIGIRFSIRSYVRPSTFATTLASTLLFRSVTTKPFEIFWQHFGTNIKYYRRCAQNNFRPKMAYGRIEFTLSSCVCTRVIVYSFVPLCIPVSFLTHNFIMHGGI